MNCRAYAALVVTSTLLSLCCYASPADGVRLSGATYELVGFSMDGKVLTRQRDAQYGVVRFEVLTLDDGREVDSMYVPSTQDPTAAQTEQVRRHQIVSPGFPGALSPSLGAAIAIIPGRLSDDGTGRFDIWLTDGAEMRVVASLPVESACKPDIPRTSASLSIDWAPGGYTAVITGHINIETPCNVPKRVPVMVTVRSRKPDEALNRSPIVRLVADAVLRYAETFPHDTLPVVRQWLALDANSVRARAALAQIQARMNKSREVKRALWSLLQLGYDGRVMAASLLLDFSIAKSMTNTPGIELLRPQLPQYRRLPTTIQRFPRRNTEVTALLYSDPPRDDQHRSGRVQ